MKKNIMAPVALAAAGILLLSACAAEAEEAAPAPAPAATEEAPAAALSGAVLADGSSTVGPFTEAAAELFMEGEPGVRVTVGISGTGGGFEKFCNGETDLSGASRPIKDEEAENCAANGIEFDFITVANDALAVVINRDNPIQCLTVDQVSEIWNKDSTVTTWGDTSIDVAADFASGEITLYGPGTDSGTFDFFTEEINGEGGNIRTDYVNIGEDDNLAVSGVAGDVNAMAFIPYSYFMENLDQVKGVDIDGGDGCNAPSEENLVAGTYTPLGRALFWYASTDALSRPETVAFFEFAINENQTIADGAGFISLNDSQKTDMLAVIQRLAGN
ncbi:MAG TPA: PstS family phosphate ABC transporter substrate-binding protein [Pontimonas sp.]|nr:PstS family phosphate ABC transporter substrate-binding protein [Pontimonas sp.]